MLLAIDSGNTNVVFTLFKGDDIQHCWRCNNDMPRTGDDYAVWLSELFRLSNMDWSDIDGCIIASVVPDAERSLITMCQSYVGINPMVVGRNVHSPYKVLVDNPSEVGADRLVNGISAHHDYDGAIIIIDFGTATTFDVFDEQASFLGGVIAPGVNLSLDALHKAAAKLPTTTVAKPPKVIGTNTIHNMQSGMYWGYVSMVEGVVERIKNEMGASSYTIIATGGLAPLFAESLPIINLCDEDLTVRGLKMLHDLNKD